MKPLRAVLKRRPDHLERAPGALCVGAHFHQFTFAHVLPEPDLRLARLSRESAEHTDVRPAGAQAEPGRPLVA